MKKDYYKRMGKQMNNIIAITTNNRILSMLVASTLIFIGIITQAKLSYLPIVLLSLGISLLVFVFFSRHKCKALFVKVLTFPWIIILASEISTRLGLAQDSGMRGLFIVFVSFMLLKEDFKLR